MPSNPSTHEAPSVARAQEEDRKMPTVLPWRGVPFAQQEAPGPDLAALLQRNLQLHEPAAGDQAQEDRKMPATPEAASAQETASTPWRGVPFTQQEAPTRDLAASSTVARAQEERGHTANDDQEQDKGKKTWDLITDKRIAQFDHRLQGPVKNFINTVEEQYGTTLRVTQGLRSFVEQDVLYARGRTSPGNIVTNARGGQSYHNYGLACDVVVMRNGQPVWEPLSKNIANIAIGLGFEWGGNWHSFKDYPHFQMTFGQSIQELQSSRFTKK